MGNVGFRLDLVNNGLTTLAKSLAGFHPRYIFGKFHYLTMVTGLGTPSNIFLSAFARPCACASHAASGPMPTCAAS